MNKEIISLLIYPVQLANINNQKIIKILEILNNEFKNISENELLESIQIKLNSNDFKKIANSIDDKNKIKYFKIAKSIVESFDSSKKTIMRLAEIGKAFKINSTDTDFKFDIYNMEEVNDHEYRKTLRNFSVVAAAIGFIPFVPISDFAILSVIHVGMITKIANIYSFKIEPKEFLKMISGALGIGLILKITTKILNSFIPFIGWVINASVAYAGTYAIGILTKRYVEEKGNLTKESIKLIWEKSFKEGKDEFWELKDYIFKKKDELLKEFEKYREKSKNNDDDTKSVDIKNNPKSNKKTSNKK